MSGTLYPGAKDDNTSLPNPGATDSVNNSNPLLAHNYQHDTENDAIKAIENKLGVGATTPASTGQVLYASNTGISTWGNLPVGGDLSGTLPNPTVPGLAGKQAILVSGVTLKTVNGNTLLGGGDLVVTASGGTWGSITGTLSSQTDLQSALNAKQNTVTLTTTGTSGAATFNSSTGALNIPQYAGTTYTAGTGLTLTTGTFSVNTSQNIATLSNLTTNGLLKVTGGIGTLGTAVAGTDYTTPTGTETLTNKTLTAPKIDSIKDTNGNTIIDLLPTSSAVNYLQVKNNAATFTPGIIAVGTDTNINVDVTPKGTGRLRQGGVIVPTLSSGDTFTNKTIDGGTNTLQNIPESSVTSLISDLAGKQATLTLTTTGTSGAATLIGATLNIPQYTGGSGGSGITRLVSNIGTNTSAGAASLIDYVYNVTATATLTLPTAVGNTNRYSVTLTGGSSTVTVATTSSQTINGSATAAWSLQYASYDFVSDGANWSIE